VEDKFDAHVISAARAHVVFATETAMDIGVLIVHPFAFVPVTVYVTAACAVVGVPENSPVEVLNESPAGCVGLTENVVAVEVGDKFVICVF